MSDYQFDDSVFDEDGDEEFEPDPAVVAFLDQESAAFEEKEDQFEEAYGFTHKCTCAQDYADGKLEMVTQCYIGLGQDALSRCAAFKWENGTLRAMLNTMVRMNEELMKVMRDNGMDDALDEFLNQEAPVDDDLDEFLRAIEDSVEADDEDDSDS